MIIGAIPLFLNTGPVGPWSFVAAGAETRSASTGALGVAMPAGILAGDLLVGFGACYAGGPWNAQPSGWTEIELANNLGMQSVVAYKIAGASEGVWDVSLSSSNPKTAVVLAYRGTKLAPFDSKSVTYTNLSSATHPTNTLTTAEANELVISWCNLKSDSTLQALTPASTTLRSYTFNYPSYPSLKIVDENQASAGTSTSRDFASEGGGNIPAQVGSLSFKQA